MADAARCFEVRGKVQNVMFRQTIVRAMLKRGLTGGASNDRKDKTLVRLTVQQHGTGDDESDAQLVELLAVLRSGAALNDWGAKATSVQEVAHSHGLVLDAHQVTTANVDDRNWNPNVTMFI